MERLWCGQRHPPVCVIESPAIVMPALVAGIVRAQARSIQEVQVLIR
jgi:hypothetical protein